MGKIVEIVIGAALLLVVIHRLEMLIWFPFKLIYPKISRLAAFFLKPYIWLYNKIRNAIRFPYMIIDRYGRFARWGGIQQVLLMSVLTVSSIVMLVVLLVKRKEDLLTTGLDILVQFPSLYIVDLIMDLTDKTTAFFSYEKMFKMTIFNVVGFSVFQNNYKVNNFIRILYGFIVLVFTTLVLQFVPTEFYDFQIRFLREDGADILHDILFSAADIPGVLGRIIAIIYLLLVLGILLFVAYIVLTVFVLAIREIVSLVYFGFKPLVALAVVAPAIYFIIGPNIFTGIFWIIGFIAITIWAEYERIEVEKTDDDSYDI